MNRLGVGVQVLGGRKLSWVEEDGDDGSVGEGEGMVDKLEMALVERAHGGDEPDRGTVEVHPSTDIIDGTEDEGGRSHGEGEDLS